MTAPEVLDPRLTERRNPRTAAVDVASSLEIVDLMNAEDRTVPEAVARRRTEIARAIDLAVAAFGRGGRLVYVGAGTSGRLGVLDAAECPPTFGTPPEMVVGVIAGSILRIAGEVGPFVMLATVLLMTMAITPILNNAATVVIMAPIVINLAARMDVSPDAFLMAVAIGASCDFLTPFGHHNNTIIMGPGGYRFGDFWRVGLGLEAIVVMVALLVIPLVWRF